MEYKFFTQAAIEKLKFYVYFLIDPREKDIDKQIFYVGKGQGNRVYDHVNGLKTAGESTATEKIDLIKQIQNENYKVEHWILRHGMDEDIALEVEAAAIDLVNFMKFRKDSTGLTNSQSGHHSGQRGLCNDLGIRYLCNLELFKTDEPVILINLNKLYPTVTEYQDLDERELAKKIYDITRQSWVLDRKRCEQAKYAVATYRGITRAAYTIEKWFEIEDEKGKRRWGFEGDVVEATVLKKLSGKSILKKKGQANPIEYVNI